MANPSEQGKTLDQTIKRHLSHEVSRRDILKGVAVTGGALFGSTLRRTPLHASAREVYVDDPTAESVANTPLLKDLGNRVNINFGVTVNGADSWTDDGYKKSVKEFGIMAPIGGALTDDVLKNWQRFKDWAPSLGMTMRLNNLFWSHDVPANLMDGAPDKPFNASKDYQNKILQSMQDRIRFAYTNFPEANEIVAVQEAFYEKDGVTGYMDSPYFRAFGPKWPGIAVVQTLQIGMQEFGRTPGKDLTLYVGDNRFQTANNKAKFVRQNMQEINQQVSSQLGINVPVGVDMQFYVDFDNNPPKPGTVYAGDINQQGFNDALKLFGDIGLPVTLGEVGFKGGSRDDRTQMLNMIVDSGINSQGVLKSMVFQNPMRINGPWGNGDLLFDANNNYIPTPTLTTIENTLQSKASTPSQ